MKLKKLLALLMVVLLIITALPMVAMAEEPQKYLDGDYRYTVTNGEATIVGIAANPIFFSITSIPKEVGGYPVVAIGVGAFKTCESINKLTIPEGVRSIGESAFYRCTGLKSIVIPESVTNIDACIFDSCTRLNVIHYTGTAEQWENVAKGEYNEILENVHCGENIIPATCITYAECGFEGCPYKSTDLGHTGGTATCTQLAVCELCGSSYGETLPHVYNNLKKDEKSHWNECDCGKSEFDYTFGHGYSRVYDETGHWLECYCGAQTDFESHDFTEVEFDDNSHWTECLCGAVNNDKTTHNYSAATCTKAKTCKVCKKTSGKALGHSYKTTTTKATTTKNGKIVKKCTRCSSSTTTTIKYVKTVKLSATSYTYDGKMKSPTVTVKDSAGKSLKKNTDYTVTYASGRKNVGKYKVTIKFKGNYSGTKTLYFTINPVKTTVSKLTAGKKSIKVAITKKSTQVTGYQIQYATNKSFKSAKTKTINSYKTTSTALSGLSAKKTYYVRVRTYKTVNGVK